MKASDKPSFLGVTAATCLGLRFHKFGGVIRHGRAPCRTDRALAVAAALIGLMLGMTNPSFGQFTYPNSLRSSEVSLPSQSPMETDSSSAASVNLRGSGFQVLVRISNLFGSGYVGITADLKTTAGPSTTTRKLTLRLTPTERHIPAERAMSVSIPMEIPQGKSQVHLQQSFPKWTIGNSLRIEVLEDGVALPNYVGEVGTAIPGFAVQELSTMLSNDLTLDFVAIGQQSTSPYDPMDISLFSNDLRLNMRWLDPNLIPSDWRLLRDIDCMIAETDVLEKLPTPQLDAIRRWILLGGTLCVTGSRENDALERLLQLRLIKLEAETDALKLILSNRDHDTGSRLTDIESFTRISTALSSNRPVNAIDINRQSVLQNYPWIPPKIQSDVLSKTMAVKEWIANRREAITNTQAAWRRAARREAGMGTVVRVDKTEIDLDYSAAVLSDIVGHRRSVMLSRGVDPIMGDTRNKTWLIPGVAQPPVYTFIGILTLFVLLVGPVAYRWTTRGHRSHLMFLIAPSLALVTTISMFAYSVISDGFGTVIRVRQLTWIDGTSGDAAERTRATLFSGISPREGLRFGETDEVMFYPDGGTTTWQEIDYQIDEVRLDASIDQGRQHFEPSILPSRTQTQFVSHRARNKLGRLSLSGLPDSATALEDLDSIKVTSTLPFELKQLVIRSPDGAYWQTESLAPKQTATVNRIFKAADASAQLGELYTLYRPIDKVSRSTRTSRSRNQRRVRDLTLFINREIRQNGEALTDGIFERYLNNTLLIEGDLTPGTFVAISQPSVDVIPVPNSQQLESVRYVMGTLE